MKNLWCRLLSAPEIQYIPILVLANKQDLPSAVAIEKIEDELQLNLTHRRIKCFPVSAQRLRSEKADSIATTKVLRLRRERLPRQPGVSV